MRLRWGQALSVALAALAVLVLTATIWADTAEPIEVFWTLLGAVGAVYAGQVWYWRWRFDSWRRSEGVNGLLAIAAEQHVWLRGAGFLIQLLILVGGLSTMATPPSVRPEVRANDTITAATLIGIGILATASAWYAERKAEQQAHYVGRASRPRKDGA